MADDRPPNEPLPGDVPVVDLVLGGWRPREAAFQLAIRLGIALGPGDDEAPRTALAATGIVAADAAAVGDPTICVAFDDAARIGAILGTDATVAVLAPRFGLPLRAENEWFFLFLRRHIASVALIGDEPPTAVVGRSLFDRGRDIASPPGRGEPAALESLQRSLLRFFPGFLPKALAERLSMDADAIGLVPIGDRHFLIPASYRDTDPRSAGLAFDHLAEIESLDDGFHGLSQSFCTSYFAEPKPLMELALHQFHGGSSDIGRSLAERARQVARRPEDMACADLVRQEIRLFDRRFAEAVAKADPSERATAEAKVGLKRLRAWAEVTLGAATAAERDLAQPLAALAAGEMLPADDLLILDAHANARLTAGDVAGAGALAEAIEAALKRAPQSGRRLAFINAMTLARIHRHLGERDAERAGFERAFAVSWGLRSLSEVIEMNAVLASAESDPRAPASRLGWLRAALAWLALDPPEGLSLNAIKALLGRADVSRTQLDQTVSDALSDALGRAWPELGEREIEPLPLFRAAVAPLENARMFAGPGAGVLWIAGGESERPDQPARRRLVRRVVAALVDGCTAAGAAGQGMFIVDANLGIDVPRTRAEALSVALRARAKDFVFENETVFLDQDMRPRFAGELRLSLSPAVVKVDTGEAGTSIEFHRNARKAVLAGEDAKLVERIARAPVALGELGGEMDRPIDALEETLRRLEAAGIVRLDMAGG